MKVRFPGYYRLKEEEIEQVWHECLFILDANVLLNLYRYPTQACEDLLRVLTQISERLWIPHQAALEYQRNRLTVIAEQLKDFEDVRKLLNQAQTKLQASLDPLKRRHSTINPDEFLENTTRVINEFRTYLDQIENNQLDVTDDDPIRDKLDEILQGKIGPLPESQEWLDNIYKEGKIRYEKKIPPGYMDQSKANNKNSDAEHIHNDLVFIREYGDLILWREIIAEVESRKTEHVVFISDDQKEDWWWVIDSKGPKTISLRPELLEELSKKTGAVSFLMYSSERFLHFANRYLQIDIEQESIKQVRKITEPMHKSVFTSNLQIDKDVIEKLQLDDMDGFLDLAENFETEFNNAMSVVERMTDHTNSLSEKIQNHADQINLLASKGKPSLNESKKQLILQQKTWRILRIRLIGNFHYSLEDLIRD